MTELVAKTSNGAPPRFAGLLVLGVAAIVAMALLSARAHTAYRPRPRRPQAGHQPLRPAAPALSWPSSSSSTTMPGTSNGQGRVSSEYRDYIKGRISGTDGIRWPDRVGAWKSEFRHRRGVCEIGRALKAAGYQSCGPTEVRGPIHADHRHYRNLFRESRADIALGCADCHRTRERLKDQGVNIYEEGAA
jgi:hypothetical protein